MAESRPPLPPRPAPRARGGVVAALVLVALVRAAVRAVVVFGRGGTDTAPPPQAPRGAPPIAAPPPAPPERPARRGRGRRVARAAVVVALTGVTALGVAGLARSFNSEISTVAGSAGVGFAGDGGAATSASLDQATGVAVAADGVVFIADSVNDRIRRIATNGTITTFAGSGVVAWSGDGGPATAAGLNTPRDVAVDSDGDVYVADTYNDVVRRIDTSGVITTVAGTGSSGWTGDGGPATSLKLSAPHGVAVEADGDLLIADTGNNRIRRVDAAGQMTTVAGTGAGAYGGDGGPATSAHLEDPVDVAPYAAGGFVIADTGNDRVRSVSAGGTITTLAGTGAAGSGGDGGPAVDAQLRAPAGVLVSGSGSVYIADRDNHRIRRVSTAGTISTSVGTGVAGFTGDGGLAAFARISSPQRLASGAGGLYFADSGNSRIRFVEGVGATVPVPTVSAVSPAGPANDNAPVVTGSAVAGSTVRLYTNSTCTSAVAATGTAAGFASPGLTATVPDDTTTTFHATATASGGGTSACSPTSASYTEDSTPPGAASVTDAPAPRSSDTTPTWTFSGPATLRCRLAGPDGEVEAWANCSSPKTPAALTADGAYTLSVLTRDAAGNESTAVTSTFTLDRVGPAAPAIGTAPAAETKDDTPTFAFTGEAGATFECRLWRDGATVPAWSACPTPHTPDISGEADGAFTFRVRAVDAALNPGAEQGATFTLDRVAPGAASFAGGTGAVGSDPDPSWTISAPAGATPQCRLDLEGDPDEEIAGWADCSSPVTFALSAEDDGSYTVGLRSRDAAGNHTPGVTRTYRLDRVDPPVPAIDAGPPAAGAGLSPTWRFSGEAGATFRCRVMRGGDVIAGWAACADPHTVSLGGQDDGTYTFSVHAVDAAQNEGDPVSRTYTLDRQAPVMSDSPPAEGNDETPTWTFSGAGAASYECRIVLDGDPAPVPAWTSCASPRTVDLSERPDGRYDFSVRALDGLGDPSVPVTDTYVLDTAAPAAAAVTGQPSGVGSQAAASWSWTGDAGVAFECRLELDGAPVGSYAPCTSPHAVELGGADGTYRLSIRALDAVGNATVIGSDQYVLDRLPPTAPVYSAAPAPAGNTPAPSWSFASDPGVSYECRLERADGAVVEPFTPCASPRSYDLAGLPDAAYVMLVRARDGAGNVALSRSAPYGLDRAGPGATQLTAAPGAVGNDPTPTWRFGATGATAFECGLVRGSSTLAALAGCGGAWTFDLTGRDDGAYTFRVRGLDEVGNPTAFLEDAYVLDTAAPRPPEIRGDEAQEGADESPTWRFSGEDGAILECQLRRGDDVISRMAVCATPRAYDLAKADDGTYTFTVRATDAAGNVGRGATATYRLDRREPAAEATPEATPAAAAAPAPPPPAAAAPESMPSSGEPAAPTADEETPAERRAERRRAARREAAADAAAARRTGSPDAAASAAVPTPERERAKKKGLAGAAEKLAEVGKVVAEAVGVAAEKSAFPGLLLAFCGVFLVIQDRIDRRDPKLALAPIDADPELEFLPLDEVAADETEGAPPCPA